MAEYVVLDSGVAIAWFFPDSDAERLYAAGVATLIRDGAITALVPDLFHVEVGSFLMRRRRTKGARFGAARLAAVLDDLDAMGLHTRVWPFSYRDVIAWAVKYHVQAKDAPFVHLAVSEGFRLATLDGGQRTAARNFGIDLVAFN